MDKIIVAATTCTGHFGSQDFALLRYRANGALDPTFGVDGVVTKHFPSKYADEVRAAAAYPRGSGLSDDIVVAGSPCSEGMLASFALARYSRNATLDSAFGSGGLLVTQDPRGAIARGVALQPGGKIVCASSAYVPHRDCREHCAVTRYNLDGTLDTYGDMTPATAFGPHGSGRVATEIGHCSEVRSVLIQIA